MSAAKVKFEDGSEISANDWDQIVGTIQGRASNKVMPTEISQDGITVKLNGLEVKKAKTQAKAEHLNYTEGGHKGWKIRVWQLANQKLYACNYWLKLEDAQYLEVPFSDVRDENGVFSYVSSIIDDM